MEESEKRKERLKTMRMEAAQAELHSDTGNFVGVSQGLANPLIEPSAPPSMPADSLASPRFEFYTDPMGAFSANRRSKVSHQNTPDYFTSPILAGPGNPNPTPFPVHQAQTNSSQDARMFQAPGSYQTPRPFGSPVPTPNQFGPPRGSTNFWGGPSGSPTYHHPSNLPRVVNPTSPDFGQGGNPSFNNDQGRAYGFNNNPQAGSDYQGSPYSNTGRGYSPQSVSGYRGRPNSHLGRGNNSPPAGFGYRGSPYPNVGRGYNLQAGSGYKGNLYSNLGRGNIPQAGFVNRGTPYPSPGRGGGRGRGRGRGSHNYVSAEERPDLFYNKSMMENPWETLTPVVWQQKLVASEKSWLPKSLTLKKACVAEKLDRYRSEPSLAEYLVASFNEAANEPDDEDAQESI